MLDNRKTFTNISKAIEKAHDISYFLLCLVYVYEHGKKYFLDLNPGRTEKKMGFANQNVYTDLQAPAPLKAIEVRFEKGKRGTNRTPSTLEVEVVTVYTNSEDTAEIKRLGQIQMRKEGYKGFHYVKHWEKPQKVPPFYC